MWKEGLCKLPLTIPELLLLVNILNSELRNGRIGGVPANTNWKAVIFTEVSGSISLVSNQKTFLVLPRVQYVQSEKPCSIV